MFEAVILAGGKGTRLKSITGEIPKPMIDVSGQPFIYRLMKKLEAEGCKKIIISLCYRASYFIDKINQDKPVKCSVVFVIEDSPLGTGGAIKLAAEQITSEKFIVLNGDTYSEIDYLVFMKYSENCDLLISGVHVGDVSRYGTLDLADDMNVISINEKGKQGEGVINSGTYVITKDSIMSVEQDDFSFEEVYLQNFKGVFKAYVTSGFFIDIGIPEDYFKACQILK